MVSEHCSELSPKWIANERAITKPVNDESDKVSVGRASFMPKKEVLGPLDKSRWV